MSTFTKEELEERLAQYRREGNDLWVGETLGSLGIYYTEVGNYQKAIDYHNQAIRVYESLGKREKMATQYNLLSAIYEVALRDMRRAIESLESAASLAESEYNRNRYNTQLEYLRKTHNTRA